MEARKFEIEGRIEEKKKRCSFFWLLFPILVFNSSLKEVISMKFLSLKHNR